MATDFIMPQAPFQQPQHMPQLPAFPQYYPYGANTQTNAYTRSGAYTSSGSSNYTTSSNSHAAAAAAAAAAASTNFVAPYNPQISPLSTSNNSSPTSPKSQYHTRQVRPMYMPAVLRPNEHPSHELPAKSRKSERGGDGADGDEADDADDDDDMRGVRSSGSFMSLPGLAAFGIGRLSRRSTNDSGKCVDGPWNLDLFPEVTGLPSREHWKADTDSSMCDEPTCKKHFSYFTRRHHCRRCGNIFCDLHSAHEIPLDEKANYNPRGSPSRSCNYCFREFKTWRTRNNSSDLSTEGSSGKNTPNGNGNGAAPKSSATAPTSPVMALATAGRPGGPGTPTVAKVSDVAQSVPGDWSWSTF